MAGHWCLSPSLQTDEGLVWLSFSSTGYICGRLCVCSHRLTHNLRSRISILQYSRVLIMNTYIFFEEKRKKGRKEEQEKKKKGRKKKENKHTKETGENRKEIS